MRLTTEKVLNDIKTYLEETAELPWGTAHIILMEAQDQISSLQRQLDYKELTDEEIKQLQRECITDAYAQAHFHGDKYINSQQAILNFARAIIRKAQEK